MSTFVVTFGQQYPDRATHASFPQAHRDGWVAVEARDDAEARSIAFQWLGAAWSMLYTREEFNPSFFPLGCLARVRRLPRVAGDAMLGAIEVEVLIPSEGEPHA